MSDKHVKRQRQRPHNSAAAGFVAIPPELDAAAGSASPLVAQLGRGVVRALPLALDVLVGHGRRRALGARYVERPRRHAAGVNAEV